MSTPELFLSPSVRQCREHPVSLGAGGHEPLKAFGSLLLRNRVQEGEAAWPLIMPYVC